MDAMRRLEQAGWKFALDERGLVYAYEPNDGLPPISERPPAVQEVVYECYTADIEEVRARADEVRAIIEARCEWEATYEERKAWLATEPDFDDEEVIGRDIQYQARLAWLSEASLWPYYNGGQKDLGRGAWRLLAELLRIEYEWRRSGRGAGSARRTSEDKENTAMGIKIEQTSYTVLPEGEYRLRIQDVTESEGKFRDQLQFKLQVVEGEYAGMTFPSWMNRVFSPKSKLYQWVEAALAVPVPADYDLDTDDLVGREVMAYVIVKELVGGGEVNRVERVRAAKVAGRKVGMR